MKSRHAFANEELVNAHSDVYIRQVDGVVQMRCLVCGEWIDREHAADECPRGWELVVGLKYEVMVGGDGAIATALLIAEPTERLLAAWYVYNWPPGSLEHKLTADRGISVVGIDQDHAMGLWDAIADNVVVPEPHVADMVEPKPAKPTT